MDKNLVVNTLFKQKRDKVRLKFKLENKIKKRWAKLFE